MKAVKTSIAAIFLGILQDNFDSMEAATMVLFKQSGISSAVLRKYDLTPQLVDLCMNQHCSVDLKDMVILRKMRYLKYETTNILRSLCDMHSMNMSPEEELCHGSDNEHHSSPKVKNSDV